MTDQQLLKQAVAKKVIVLHETDFDCSLCGLNFNHAAVRGKLSPMTFVLAHLKMCRASSPQR